MYEFGTQFKCSGFLHNSFTKANHKGFLLLSRLRLL